MEARELRIGNLVTYNPNAVDKGTPIMPLRVTCVDSEVGVLLDDGFANCYAMDEILPIELTPEILEKCGFKKTGAHSKEWNKSLKHGYLYAWVGNDVVAGHCLEVSDQSYDTHSSEIRYLHQLQNLYFSLTGEELAINL